MKKPSKAKPLRCDSPWKKILDALFQPALELCFPDIASQIDWSKGVELLDKEFEQIVRRAELGGRQVDKLVKVWRRDGKEQVVMFLMEVQAQREQGFPRRVFDYYSRIGQRYDRPVAVAVVYADPNPKWRPTKYESGIWGCKVKLEFPAVKLLDLAADEAALLANPNPFAIVVLAQVQALKTRKSPARRFYWKKRLTQLGYERGYTRDQIMDLFTFIDWVMVLPDALERKFDDEMVKFEAKKRMPYITSIERRGRAEGRVEGRAEGRVEGRAEALRKSALDILEARFDEIPYELREQIQALQDRRLLKHLPRWAAVAKNLKDFQKHL